MRWNQKQVSTAVIKSGLPYAKVTLNKYTKEELLMRAKAHNWEMLNNGKAWRPITPKDKTTPRGTNGSGGCGGSDWVPDQLWVCAVVPTGDDIADDECCQEIGHYVDNPNSGTWSDQPPCDYPPPPSDCELYGIGCGGEEPDPGDGCTGCGEEPPLYQPIDDKIEDSLSNDCLKNVLNTMLINNYKSTLSKMLNNIFGQSTRFDIVFKETTALNDFQNGETQSEILSNGVSVPIFRSIQT